MASIIEPNEHPKGELLDLFISENDQKGTDLLAMSNYFDTFIGKIEGEMGNDSGWEVINIIDSLKGQIAAAIKCGFDISQMKMLVADYSHFSQEIIDGLETGLYHVGQSKEIAGNLRPAILDDKERLVKFFTLKKSVNPSDVLSDISTLSMQASLQKISAQIEDIGRDVKAMIDFARREQLSNKFIYARDKIMLGRLCRFLLHGSSPFRLFRDSLPGNILLRLRGDQRIQRVVCRYAVHKGDDVPPAEDQAVARRRVGY